MLIQISPLAYDRRTWFPDDLEWDEKTPPRNGGARLSRQFTYPKRTPPVSECYADTKAGFFFHRPVTDGPF